jgi:CRP-like cAMP-binding protein
MKHRVIPRRAERLVISRLLIELARVFHKRTFVGSHAGKPFGSEIDIVFVAACVAIGDFENRPMSASDVSHYIDMARATVQRKLDELVGRDILVRESSKYRLSPYAVVNGEAFVALANRVIRKALPKE